MDESVQDSFVLQQSGLYDCPEQDQETFRLLLPRLDLSSQMQPSFSARFAEPRSSGQRHHEQPGTGNQLCTVNRNDSGECLIKNKNAG